MNQHVDRKDLMEKCPGAQKTLNGDYSVKVQLDLSKEATVAEFEQSKARKRKIIIEDLPASRKVDIYVEQFDGYTRLPYHQFMFHNLFPRKSLRLHLFSGGNICVIVRPTNSTYQDLHSVRLFRNLNNYKSHGNSENKYLIDDDEQV